MTRRVPIVPHAVSVSPTDEALKVLEARRIGRGLGPFGFDSRKRYRALLDARFSRLLGAYPTLRDMSAEKREPIRQLACAGAALLGPVTLDAVDNLAGDLHAEAPWLREVSSFIMLHLRANIDAGETGLILPPILLVGDPGCGKSQYARSIADVAGVPLRRIDVGSGSAGFRISGLEKGWGSAAPGVPVETVITTQVANPVFVVDEVDKAGMLKGDKSAGTSVTVSLLEMLEPATAAKFECPAYRLPFDMSRLVWILTANDLDSVPAPIRDRCRVFRVPNPTTGDLLSVFDRQTGGIGDRDLVSDARATLQANLSSAVMSLRRLGAFIDAVRAFSSKPRYH